MLNHTRRFFALIPAILAVIACTYFVDLLQEIDIALLSQNGLDLIKKLQFAIGLLLFFTVLANWIMIVYVKHVRYTFNQKTKRGASNSNG